MMHDFAITADYVVWLDLPVVWDSAARKRGFPRWSAGETVFVPARGGRREDDGWLMTIVHDLTRSAASLVILDAKAPAHRPVATIHLSRRVPYGYHGEWIPGSALNAT